MSDNDPSDRIGWYEFVTANSRALTFIAYVYESGDVYLPEGGDSGSFHLASASGRAWRLVREDDLTAELKDRLAQCDALVDAARAVGEKWAAMRGDYQSTGESVELAELLDQLAERAREVGT